MSITLNPLQIEAAEMLASGATPQQTKDVLALSLPEFMAWRSDALFVSEVARLRAERKAGASKTSDDESTDRLDTELDRMSS